jgi:peptidoglycan/LPS O-acetylase OafA/YrhL
MVRDLAQITMAISTAEPEQLTKASPRQAAFYRPELDALRFFAFFAVFLRHSLPANEALYRHLPIVGHLGALISRALLSGALGVDLFFTLSAYLITELLLREKESCGGLDVRYFYVRRILRIWPLYFAFIAFSLLLTRFVSGQALTASCVGFFLLLSGNWYCVLHNYPASVIAPLWSVSIEEQFYLLWPLVVRRASMKTIGWFAAGMLVVANLARLVLLHAGAPQVALWTSTPTRIDPIACGILLALWLRRGAFRASPLNRAVVLSLGFAAWLFASSLGIIDGDVGTARGMVAYPLAALGAVLIFLAFYDAPADGVRVLDNPTLRYLGRISYGLYVFHFVGLLFAHRIVRHSKPLAWLVAFACTLAMSMASYRFIETPFLRWKLRFTHVESRPV